MAEGNSPEQNSEDKGFMGKAHEFFRNLGGKGGEGSGLKGDPEAEARLSEEREKSAADLDQYRQRRREELGIQSPEEGSSNTDVLAQPDAPQENHTQEAPDELDKAA